MEVSMFKGKSIEKLIEAISSAIGTMYKPRSIRKQADARAYEIETISKATANADATKQQIEMQNAEMIQNKVWATETKRLNNIDNVIHVAAEQLQQQSVVSQAPVNLDWMTRFLNIVQDISDDEMQKLWGRILSGEVKEPESFSLRTLETLKNISRKEALAFENVAKYAIYNDNTAFIIGSIDSDEFEDQFNVSPDDTIILADIGILNAMELVTQIEVGVTEFKYGGKGIDVEMTSGKMIEIDSIYFTQIGIELLKLTHETFNLDYINIFAAAISRKGVKVKLIENGRTIDLPTKK